MYWLLLLAQMPVLPIESQVSNEQIIVVDYSQSEGDAFQLSAIPESAILDFPEQKKAILTQTEGTYTLVLVATKDKKIATAIKTVTVGKIVPSISDSIKDAITDPNDAERFAGAYAAILEDLDSINTNQELVVALGEALKIVNWPAGKYPKLTKIISTAFPIDDEPLDRAKTKLLINQIIKGASNVRLGK